MTDVPKAASSPPVDWDARTVDRAGGHVYQSVAWASHRSRSGWSPRFITSGEHAVLALTRRWPAIGGGSAYIPRGPVPSTDGRLAGTALAYAVTGLRAEGVDVIAADAEVPAADAAYRAVLDELGFHPIEEIQPSRHRICLPLDPAAGEEAAFGHFAKSTRQRIRQAERAGSSVVRHDALAGPAGPGDGFVEPPDDTAAALDRFYDLLLATGERRHFSFGPRSSFVSWWRAAHAAGHLVYLEARSDDEPVAGLILYRHGERLTTVHSGDRAETRDRHPGALHLLRWRAIQLAVREGRTEMDLGGVDIAGARREPREGDPLWGLYHHKLSFGGRWLQLTGAQELVIRRWRYSAGRIVARLARR
jgi:lipid II:glycine glycyltransferase (peptidoglycan interpeptide bridge formation enzyme)